MAELAKEAESLEKRRKELGGGVESEHRESKQETVLQFLSRKSKEMARKNRSFEGTPEEKVFIQNLEFSWDLRQLTHSILKFGDITAKDGHVYTVDYLTSLIGSLKNPNDPNLLKVTRTYGLRDKVKELLEKKGKDSGRNGGKN